MGLLDWDEEQASLQKAENKRKAEAKANKLLKERKTRRGKRKKNKRKVPKMNYRTYIKSAYWKKRKNDYFGAFGKKCAVCGKKYGVTLHHKTYNVKFGEEPNDALVALCPFHHKEFHDNHQLKTNMVKESNEYVEIAKITHQQFRETNLDDLSWI